MRFRTYDGSMDDFSCHSWCSLARMVSLVIRIVLRFVCCSRGSTYNSSRHSCNLIVINISDHTQW